MAKYKEEEVICKNCGVRRGSHEYQTLLCPPHFKDQEFEPVAPTPDAGMVEVMDKLAKVEIPVIIDPGEAKWFYLGLAQGMRSMARAALAALPDKEGGGE